MGGRAIPWGVLVVLGCGGADPAGTDDTGGTSAATTATTTATSVADTSTTTGMDGSSGDTGGAPMWLGPGPHAVGHATTTLMLADARSGRVQWWYPAEAAGDPTPLAELEPAGADRDALAPLVDGAPAPCTRKVVGSTADAAPQGGDPWPVVVFSHCSDCVRYSSASLAEQLASWGFVVVAPDHPDNTLFDELDGTSVGVSQAFLATRGDDVVRVIDAIGADGDDVPPALRGHLDPGRLGVMGHSFGSVTAGFVAERDDRVDAVVGIAAPMENPLLPGVSIAAIDVPMLLLLAQEDNSILELGNNLIRSNFDDANPPVWLVEFVDAGHWSFSDICALVDGFAAGCGEGVRQTAAGEPFIYVDIEATRARAGDWVTTFFAAHLLGDDGAATWLAEAPADPALVVDARP